MSTSSTRRSRSDRLAALSLGPGRIGRLLDALSRGPVLGRLGLCLAAAVAMWVINGAWAPPFAYRVRFVPQRDIQSRVNFGVLDEKATRDAGERAAKDVVGVYNLNPAPIEAAQQSLKDDIFKVIRRMSAQGMGDDIWKRFYPLPIKDGPQTGDPARLFESLKEAVKDDQELARFSTAVKRALANVERNGLLVHLDNIHVASSTRLGEIEVLPVQTPARRHIVKVDDVRIETLQNRLRAQLEADFKTDKLSVELAEPVYYWLLNRLTAAASSTEAPILSYNESETKEQARLRQEEVLPIEKKYLAHEDLVVVNGPLLAENLQLLRREHEIYVGELPRVSLVVNSVAYFGLCLALYVLCGFYIWHRDRRLIAELRHFGPLLVLVVLTVGLYRLASFDQWWAELIPVILFGMTTAIVYRQELALLLTSAVTLVCVISCGHGLDQFVLVLAAGAVSILLMGRVRSRTKLLYDGLATGLVATCTYLGVETLTGQPLTDNLLGCAAWYGFCGVLSGLIMTGLLPFIERMFDVQTDISLLELGDAAHPLLQELVRRAPGTYNHSINVASISEAAAEAIGANGLLCRVGSYFHDIGKMLKPGYFVENQGTDASRHESLVPTMSTLVIIAHVKDGADLARQHSMPQSIIDFIEQHHGTTLVEYFYRQARRDSEDDPDSSPVDENSFRYPGPKPQTREAGVMMLADAVEGASRTLVDPTPARIESLVHDILMKRLLDGQFDECGLTLRELHIIEDSLVKSLTAVYHGRVKYPSQATA